MKILVTGVKGQLGYDVVAEAEKRGITAVGVDIEEMDITDPKQCEAVIKAGNYDAVVHCGQRWMRLRIMSMPAVRSMRREHAISRRFVKRSI